MIRAIRPAAVARDDASLISGWNIAPNVGYTVSLSATTSAVVVILASADGSTLIGSGVALVGTDQPVTITPVTGQAISMVDADLGWHLLLSADGTEGDRSVVMDPMVDLADEIHPIYTDDNMALARATAAINSGASYVDDVSVNCPRGLGAAIGDVVGVPVNGSGAVGQVESVTWSGTPDGTSETAVIRRHTAIAPEAYVPPLPPPVLVDDTAETDAATVTSGNVLSNDTGTLTVVAVNGLSVNVGEEIEGSNGGMFTIAADGAWTFDPSGDFSALTGTDTATTSVSYHASDGTAEAMGTLTVTVSAALVTTSTLAVLYPRVFNYKSAIRANDGGYFISGSADGIPMVARISAEGAVVWARTLSLLSSTSANSIQSDGSFVYFTLFRPSTSTTYTIVVKMTVDGSLVWCKSYHSGSYVASCVCLLCSDGNLYVASHTYSSGTYHTKISSNDGAVIWSFRLNEYASGYGQYLSPFNATEVSGVICCGVLERRSLANSSEGLLIGINMSTGALVFLGAPPTGEYGRVLSSASYDGKCYASMWHSSYCSISQIDVPSNTKQWSVRLTTSEFAIMCCVDDVIVYAAKDGATIRVGAISLDGVGLWESILSHSYAFSGCRICNGESGFTLLADIGTSQAITLANLPASGSMCVGTCGSTGITWTASTPVTALTLTYSAFTRGYSSVTVSPQAQQPSITSLAITSSTEACA